MIERLSVDEIIERIETNQTFIAQCEDDSFKLTLEEYFPYICTARRNGSGLRAGLRDLIQLDPLKRWVAEAPRTGDLIQSFPICLTILDSVFVYDLTHAPDSVLAEDQSIWRDPLPPEEKELSRIRHHNIYRVLHALIRSLEQQFGGCLLFDVDAHSPQPQSPEGAREPDLYQLTMAPARSRKWAPIAQNLELGLETPVKGGLAGRVGRANRETDYLYQFVRQYNKTLLLGISIRKVYCNVDNGDVFPEVLHDLEVQLKTAILSTTALFTNRCTRLHIKSRHSLIGAKLDEKVILVDKAIYQINKGISTLLLVNPMNIEAERRKFLARRRQQPPVFKYLPLNFDPIQKKRELYQLPVEDIDDAHLREFYGEIIEYMAVRLDLLQARETSMFQYHSLLMHGEPEKRDIANALYVLHCPDKDEPDDMLSDVDAVGVMKDMIATYGFKARVELVQNLASRIAVINATRLCKIRKGEVFTRAEITALAHHEIGVHMVTNVNASAQPLLFARLGLPYYTETQEGMALLAEYLSGNLRMKRLRELAYRVLAVQCMIDGADFIETWRFLTDTHGLSHNQAFFLTTRVHRGGGFTKDYVYLRGLRRLYAFYREKGNFSYLMLGKTSIDYIPMLEELMNRNVLKQPKYTTHVVQNPKPVDPLMEYVLDGLR